MKKNKVITIEIPDNIYKQMGDDDFEVKHFIFTVVMKALKDKK